MSGVEKELISWEQLIIIFRKILIRKMGFKYLQQLLYSEVV